MLPVAVRYLWGLNVVKHSQSQNPIRLYLLEVLSQTHSPQNRPNWVLNPKRWWYFPGKVENETDRKRQKLKLGMDKLWKNVDAIGYVRILGWPQGAIYAHFFPSLSHPHHFIFGGEGWGMNFTTILWFFWDLVFMLFDSPNDLVFGGFFFFTNISDFPGVNCPQKFNFDFTLKFNFGYIPLEPK